MPASAGSIDRAAVRRSAESLLEEEGDPDDLAGPASTRVVCNVRTVTCVRVHHNTNIKRNVTPRVSERSRYSFFFSPPRGPGVLGCVGMMPPLIYKLFPSACFTQGLTNIAAADTLCEELIRRVRCAHRGREGVLWRREGHAQHACVVVIPHCTITLCLCVWFGAVCAREPNTEAQDYRTMAEERR